MDPATVLVALANVSNPNEAHAATSDSITALRLPLTVRDDAATKKTMQSSGTTAQLPPTVSTTLHTLAKPANTNTQPKTSLVPGGTHNLGITFSQKGTKKPTARIRSDYFAKQFARYLKLIRASKMCGLSIATIVTRYGGISEETLKTALKGGVVGSRSIGRMANVTFALDPLSAIEFRIRHAENQLKRYLIGRRAKAAHLKGLKVGPFFDLRAKRARSPEARLRCFFDNALRAAQNTHRNLSGYNDGDQLTIPRSSVSSICGGARRNHIDFFAVCKRLDLSDRMMTCARILLHERHFGATLLGSDETLFSDVPSSLPRLGALLVFASNNAWELA